MVLALLWSVHWVRPIGHWLPFGIHPASGVTAVIGGLALAGVARGVRLGYRRSWVAALVLLLVSTVYRLVHDVGPEGSPSPACSASGCCSSTVTSGSARPACAGSSAGPSWPVSWWSGWSRGLDVAFVQARETRDVVVLVIVGLVVLVLATALPGREHRRTGEERAQAFARARAIFDRYGGDTLDYFALRDDKSWLFSGNTLVAYSVINRVMLVSPDPIGPVDERLDAWTDAMDLADTNGWYICVLGASAPWLPIYQAAGLTEVYMGDEAIVDCQVFSLKGKSMKSLRGAYNRVSKAGYRVDGHARPRGQRGAAQAAGGTRHRDPPGRGRARLLHDPEPDVRRARHRPAARGLPGPGRKAGGVQPVRPGQPSQRLLAGRHAAHQRPGRAQRPDRLRDHRDDQLDGRARA